MGYSRLDDTDGWLVADLLVFLAKVDSSSGQPVCEEHVGEIYGDTQVGQTFAAPHSDLYRVDVLLLSYVRINTHDVVFHLKASPKEEKDLLGVTINARQVTDGDYFGFTFPQIPDSAGKTFFFYLDSPESVPGDAITIGSKGGDPYAEGTAYLNGSPTERALTFGTLSNGTLGDRNCCFEPSGRKQTFYLGRPAFVFVLGISVSRFARSAGGSDDGGWAF
jgi:hypothetical protein